MHPQVNGRKRRAAPLPAPENTAVRSAEVDPVAASDPDAGAREGNDYRDLDHAFHAALAYATLGISPASLLQAWQDWAHHLAFAPGKQQEILAKGFEKVARLQHFLTCCAQEADSATPCISPLPQDRRFRDPAWQAFPFNAFYQSFLLTQQWWHNATSGVPGVTARHERLVEFYSRQFLDMISPSNFPATNPEIIGRTVREGGANLVRGLDHLADDIKRSISSERPAGAEAFRVGVEVAATPGTVVFRNELMELIQYRPTTQTVKAEPVLIVPAWIMKYYILDLSAQNSLIRYLVGQGFTVFCISWRNPGPEQRELSFDDYRRLGVMAGLDAVGAITASPQIHAVGYCLGGTLLSVAAAAMARDGDERLASLSLFAAQVDFEEPGELGLFISESQVSFLEDIMWREGYLDQRRMAGAFQMLRSQDLVWSRMVRNYFLGERPAMTDLTAWNADATRMPYRMHSDYLRKLFLNNDLAAGRFRVDGRPVHVEAIRVPVFVVGTVTDHVAPWRSVFKLTHLLDADVDFVLTSGGHNAGIVSEPGHPRRSFRLLRSKHGDPLPDPDQWASAAPETAGSWWPNWVAWLAGRSGADVTPPAMGRPEKGYAPICDAPGTYVLQA